MYQTHFLDMVRPVLGLAPVTITAGGAGDNVQQNGATIDRQGYGNENSYAVIVGVAVSSTLTDAATATVSAKIQDSTDGSNWTDYREADDLVLTGGTGGSTETAIVDMRVNLQAAKRYIRVAVTVNLSAGAVDTASIASVVSVTGNVTDPV